MYKCANPDCNREILDIEEKTGLVGVRCPYCGHRIIFKKRAPFRKKIRAR